MKNIFTVLILIMISGVVMAQKFTISDPNITTCDGELFDTGGEFGEYGISESIQTTICSGSGSADASHVELDFVDIDLAIGDSISFFDGSSNLGRYIGSIKDNISGGVKVRSTAVNTSGCITMRFKSNGNTGGTGWMARIKCVESCQEVYAELVSTAPVIEDGSIDICLGETIRFSGSGYFPQDGFEYSQTLSESNFEWDFDDGIAENGANVSHTFDKPGGYNVTLVVYDKKGCSSSNYVNCKVRVAPPPTISKTNPLPATICPNDTITLNSDLSNIGSYINVTPNPVVFSKQEIFSNELFLPDGFDEYSTVINLNGFKANARIADGDDIESIFVNMEHSYLLDLGVKLTCPNGASVNLVNFGGFISDRKVVLGLPLENPENPCDNKIVAPGIGADYTWKANSQNDTWTVEALKLPKNSSLPSDVYKSSDSFDGLVGCPINGDWTLSVSDNIACDNGWIFSWGIGFSKADGYRIDTFQANIMSSYWESNVNDIGTTNEELILSPVNPGVAAGVFTIVDDFGCTYHDTVSVKVLSPKSGACLKCNLPEPPIDNINVCKGRLTNLDASLQSSVDNIVTFENNLPIDFTQTANVNLEITDFYPATVSSLNRTIENIQIVLNCDRSEDIEVNIISPDSKILNLIERGDILNRSIIDARFSTNSNTPILQYSGSNTNYRPAGSWSSINGATTNGNWKIEVIDHSNNQSPNSIVSCNLALKPISRLDYKWTGNSIDCSDCSEIEVLVNNNEDYTVEVTDSYGCSISKTIEVKSIDSYDSPKPWVQEMKDGSVYFKWDPVPEISQYKVKVNDGVWRFSSEATGHIEPGFSQGAIVDFQVKSVPDEDIFCDEEIASLRVIYDGCFMVVNAVEQVPVRCYGTATGEIFVDVLIESVTPPVEYKINNLPFQGSPLFPAVSSGTYFITVKDADGCMGMDTITLVDPPEIIGNAVATDISCNGLTDGSVMAGASGGTPPYVYYWNTAPFTTFDSVAIDLAVRDYTVSIKDANGCEVFETVSVNEPSVLNYSSTTTNPTCFGGHNGLIDVEVSGGTPVYTITWDNGTVSEDLVDVTKGNYSYTVTDARGCSGSEDLVITEPVAQALLMNTSDVLCNGLLTGSASVLPSGVFPFTFNWSNDGTINSPNNLNIGAGTYDITVTDNDGCISYSTGVVSEPEALSSTLSKVDIKCQGEETGSAEIVVAGGNMPYVYNWNDVNNQSSSVASNLPLGTYMVTVTDANNCTLEESIELTEPAILNIVKTHQDVSCLSATNGSAKVTLNGGVPPFNYLWNDANNQTSSEAVGLTSGNYTVSITDANNCLKTVDFVVGLNPNQVAIDSVQTISPICNGQNNGSISVFPSGGAEPYSYLWNDSNAQIAKDANYLLGGTYTVTITDAGNCTTVESIVLPEPLVLEGVTQKIDVVCKDASTGEALVSVIGGVKPYNYQWNDSNFQIDDKAVNLSAGIYVVTVGDANNCEFETSVEIEEPLTSVVATVTQDKIGCFNGNTNSVSVSAVGGTPGYTYNWDFGSSKTTIDDISPGLHSVTATDNVGCEAIASIDIQELEKITAEFLYIKPTCFGLADGKIGVNSVMGGDGNDMLTNYHYSWDTDPVQNTEIATNLEGDSNYGLTITDNSGCLEAFELSLSSPEEISIGYSQNDVNCYGYGDGTINLDDVTGGSAPYTASWGANANNSNSVSLFNLGPDKYYVTVTDSKGCTEVEEMKISEPEELSVDFRINNTNCHSEENGMITIIPIGGTAPYTYVWDNGQTSSVLENLAAGNYSLSLTDKNGCSLQVTKEILPPYYIGANIHTNPTTCIDTKDGILKVYPYGGFYPFTISVGDEIFSDLEVFSDLAQGEYKVQVKDSLECIWDTIVVINHAPIFAIDAGKDIEIFYGDKHEFDLQIENSAGTPEFEWIDHSDEGTLNCTDCKNPIASPTLSQFYDIYAIDENGCEAEDKVKINVKTYRHIDIPSGFSPNGDGKNELLVVHGKTRFVKNVILFQVFDQWGELIYEDRDFDLNDNSRGWDGKFRGKEMLPGVYLWRIEIEYVDGYKDQFTGETSLIK